MFCFEKNENILWLPKNEKIYQGTNLFQRKLNTFW